jgi:hypothetical protein
MSLLSRALSNIGSVASGKKDLFNRESVLGKLDLGAFRQLRRLSGGEESRKEQMRRYGNSASGLVGGAVGGFITGGPVGAFRGAATGGVGGYQNDKVFTGKSALTEAGKGVGYGAATGLTTARPEIVAAAAKVAPYLVSALGGGGQEQQPTQEMRYQQWLMDMRQKRYLDEIGRAHV